MYVVLELEKYIFVFIVLFFGVFIVLNVFGYLVFMMMVIWFLLGIVGGLGIFSMIYVLRIGMI